MNNQTPNYKPPMHEPPTGPQPPKDHHLLIALIMVAVVVWGTFLAAGAYLAKHDARLPAIIMGCVCAFLFFWWLMLASRRRREQE